MEVLLYAGFGLGLLSGNAAAAAWLFLIPAACISESNNTSLVLLVFGAAITVHDWIQGAPNLKQLVFVACMLATHLWINPYVSKRLY